jgi:hypothetical protein
MLINLYTSAKPDRIASYTSAVVPRVGEHIRLMEAPGVIMLVTDVCYQAHGTDRGNERIDLQITAANDAARQYLGQMLYMSI